MRYVLGLILSLMGIMALADSHFFEQAEEALSGAQVFDDFSIDGARDTINLDIETDLPLSSMDEATLGEAGAVAASGATEEGEAYRTFNENAVEWSIESANPDNLTLADTVEDDPETFMEANPFSSSGGSCTVTDFSAAPRFERSCQRTREGYGTTCTSALTITVVRTETYECNTIGTGFACEELETSPLCGETSRVCTLLDIDGNCIEQVAEHTCSSDEPMTFTAPQTGTTSWAEPIMSWSTTCPPEFNPVSCGGGVTSCVAGPSVEDVNGLLVPVDCTTRQTVYECGGANYTTEDCAPFETDPGCTLLDSVCFLDETSDGVCGGYEDTYQCGSDEHTDFDASCADVNVCVNDFCQSVPQETNSDLPLSMAAIGMLNSMAAEWDPGTGSLSIGIDGVAIVGGELEFFNTEENYCRVGALSTFNCCNDSGWAHGVFGDCREHEYELIAAQEAGRTVFTETYCRRSALFVCLQRARRYCVFSGRIAREVSYQGQRQLTGEFECRALSYEEMETIDWTAIDLSSVFGEMLASVDMASESDLIDLIQANTSALAPRVVETYEE